MSLSSGILDSNQKIVASGLRLNIDAGQLRSYGGSGTTWTDLSGNGFNATLNNGPVFNSSLGGYFAFDGVDDTAGTSLTNTPNNSTMILWFRWDGVNRTGVLSYLGAAGSNGMGLYQNNNTINVLYGGITTTAVSTSITLTANVFMQLAITRTATTTTLYKNGVAIASTTSAPNSSTTALGFLVMAATKADVAISRFYNRALSTAELLNNFNDTKPRFGYPNESIVTSGLILNHDVENLLSYPGTGTGWSSLSMFNATMNGTVGYTNTSPKSFNYVNATSNYFQGNNNLNSIITTGITIISCINITDISVRSMILSKYNTVAPNGYSFEAGTASGLWTNTLRFYAKGTAAASSDYRGVTNAISQNTNIVVAATFDFATKTTVMYVNGSAISATQIGTPASISSDWYNSSVSYKIGSMRPVSNIDAAMNQYNLLVYNRALSATEIKQNFDSQKSRFGL
jgi:hypothetical protein